MVRNQELQEALMTKFTPVAFTIALLFPLSVQAQQLSEAELIQFATEQGACGDRAVVAAAYGAEGSNTIQVTCGDDAEGFVPLAGLGLGGAGAAAAGLALAAAAAGGGGGSTPGTNGTN
jgi:hypothetical protein